jgi:hypothetical protein
VIQGSAKAWVYFDGTGTPAIRASYNVSSITDNGTANYTVNFTNAFADANYAITGTAAGPGAGAAHVLVPNVSFDVEYPPSTTSCRVGTLEPGGSWNDVKYIYVAIFR